MVDCPDCGGVGEQPPHAIRVEWRLRDIGRAAQSGQAMGKADAEWLLSQLEGARFALMQVLTLAQEIEPQTANVTRMRFLANKALGLYSVTENELGNQEIL